MESVTDLIPESSQRSGEDRIMIATVMRSIADYIKAVKDFGPRFFTMPIKANSRFDEGREISQAKTLRDRKVERIKALAYGKIAHQYLFLDDGNEVGFLPTCKALGFNAMTFRAKLKGLTKKEAAKLYTHFLRGSAKVNHMKGRAK
jgi:hypothetical protein